MKLHAVKMAVVKKECVVVYSVLCYDYDGSNHGWRYYDNKMMKVFGVIDQ